jgi:hypothetical protein
MSAVNYLLPLVKQNSCLLRSLKDETVIVGLAEVIRPHCSGVSTIEFHVFLIYPSGSLRRQMLSAALESAPTFIYVIKISNFQ